MPKLGKAPAHWLLEGLFILVSVGLAFGVAEFRESRANHELAGRVLKSLQTEVEHNIAILEPLVPIHSKWLDALEKADTTKGTQAALDVWFATRPALPADAKSPFPFLHRSAWDAALSGGVLRLIDYDVAAALSDIYRVQEITTENVDRLAKGGRSPRQPPTTLPAGRPPCDCYG